ncbi:fructosamine kinase [Synechococcus sp. RSCCF101]|nr:fructosamine kinase [Synechococcus sp. RSCCF101]
MIGGEGPGWLSEALGRDVLRLEPVAGGCIHAACRALMSDGSQLFVKSNSPAQLELFASEVDGLDALRRLAPPGLVVPAVEAWGVSGGRSYLVLEWLPLLRSGDWSRLGTGLARLHRRSASEPVHSGAGNGERFGWHRNNAIGSAPQSNRWHGSWGMFFRQERLLPQLQWAGIEDRDLPGLDRALERLPAWLDAHACDPCLVHGDLWSGNAALLDGGGGSLYDPAVYLGDREVDLAMARLFGGFPESLFEAYEEEWPLPPGHRERSEVYDLYHLLNHANLFGGGYQRQARASIRTMLRLLERPPV